MSHFNNMKLGVRLGFGFGTIVLLLIATAVVGITRINAVEHNTEVIAHDRFVKVNQAHDIENEVNKQSRALRTALIAPDANVVKAELAKIEESGPVIVKALEALQATVRSEKGRAALAGLLEARNAFVAHEQRLVALIAAGQIEAGRTYLVKEMLLPQGAYLKAIEHFADTQEQSLEEFAADAAVQARSANIGMTVLAVLATLTASGLGFWLTRSITRPIGRAVQVAQTVAAGDLTSHIEVTSKDETGQLLAALKTMNASLMGIVHSVRQGSDSIATGTSQIATGNADLSQRTEEQAANLQQTAASMEELTVTVRQNSETAQKASELADGASQAAAHGGVVVGQVVSTMQGITDSSRRINDIIGVIDGIAFQTNILALNAAVESARAGEQGRGFAVVASEVRALAQRSAEAAKEIKTLIVESAEKVESGSKLVADAGQSMNDIVSRIKHVSDLIGEISAASAEQTQGIGQVGDAVTQLDQVTQQNSALVEESAAAADSLRNQAAKLAEVVGQFKLEAAV